MVFTVEQESRIRDIVEEMLDEREREIQSECKHVEGVMHKDGSVTCKTCHYMTNPPYDADL